MKRLLIPALAMCVLGCEVTVDDSAQIEPIRPRYARRAGFPRYG